MWQLVERKNERWLITINHKPLTYQYYVLQYCILHTVSLVTRHSLACHERDEREVTRSLRLSNYKLNGDAGTRYKNACSNQKSDICFFAATKDEEAILKDDAEAWLNFARKEGAYH